MSRSALAHGAAALAASLVVPATAVAQPVPPVRLSVSTAGTQGNGSSSVLAIDRSGRTVLFLSSASNLVANDTNGHADLFIRDRDTDRDGLFDEPGAVSTLRVSEGLAGEQGGDSIFGAELSGDGRFVLFTTVASLVAADTNGLVDVYLRDRDTDADGVFDEPGAIALTQVSTGTAGTQGDGASQFPSMTPDGRYVAFRSSSSTFTPRPLTADQVYRKDLLTGLLTLVSSQPDGTPGDWPPDFSPPAITADGRLVAFGGGFRAFFDVPAGTPRSPWVLRDLVANTLTPIALPDQPASTLPVGTSAADVTDGFVYSYATAQPGFTNDDRTLYLGEGAVFVGIYSTANGSILEYDIPSGRVTRRFPGLATTIIGDAGPRFRLPDLFVYRTSYLSLPCPGADVGSVARFDRRTGRVTHLVEHVNTSASSSAVGRRVLFASPGCGTGPPAGTYLLDVGYGVPLSMPDPVRPGLLDDAGNVVVFHTDEATILPAGVDTNGVLDVFAVDLLSRLDRDVDGLDDLWEVATGLDCASSVGPNGADGDPDGDGVGNVQEFVSGTHPRGAAREYLAEGVQNAFFKTRLAIANPGTVAATAFLRVDRDNGRSGGAIVHVPAGARRTVFADEVVSAVGSFGIVVDAEAPLVVERTMSWDATEYGAHAERASRAPSTSWFLAEGATGSFSLFYLLQNPGDTAATATVRYLRPAPLAPIDRSYTLPPHSRTTLPINSQAPELTDTDVSASITATQPIFVERAMYRTVGSQTFAAGHASAGVAAAATNWFLAEGATGPFFDLFVLLANPNVADATVEIRYLLTTGEVLTKSYTVAAESRRTIYVDGETFPGLGQALANTTLSCAITSTNAVPIVVERSMWFPGPAVAPTFWTEAHNSPGTTTTATRWVLADGESGGTRDTQTFVLIANTSATAGRVRVTQLPDAVSPLAGAPPTFVLDLPPNSRTTVPLHAAAGFASRRYGVVVESVDTAPLAQIVVERAMYWNAGGVVWAAGTNLLATPIP
jgi:hypothetical protein